MTQDGEFARAEVVRIARAMVNGEIRPLLGARQLCPHMHKLASEISAQIWKLMVGIDSECHALPIGPERQYWATDALIEKDKLAASYEQQVGQDLLRAANQLLSQYTKDTETKQ